MESVQSESARGAGWRLRGEGVLRGDGEGMGTCVLCADGGEHDARGYAKRQPRMRRISASMRI